MNEFIFTPPCVRCQRREAALDAYAADIVQADARIADLEADVRTLREILCRALDLLHTLTLREEHRQQRMAAICDELRSLRAAGVKRELAA